MLTVFVGTKSNGGYLVFIPALLLYLIGLPLSALAEGTPYKSNYLRTLAQRGKLKAIKDGSLWLSSKDWLNEYLNSKDARGRKK